MDKMGNYTWFIRCIANHPVDDDGCVPIVDLLANFHHEYDWFFEEWVQTLSEDAQNRFKKACKQRSPDNFKAKLMKYDVFPKTVSLNVLMSFFEDRKFYGYLDENLMEMMTYINRHCLPPHVEMMMLGLYEGFGPVAMGWCKTPDTFARRFVSMMGYERYSVCCSTGLLKKPMITHDEYMEYVNNEYAICDCKMSPSELEDEERRYHEMVYFRSTVLDPLDKKDWTSTTDSICKWLLEKGFQLDNRETAMKTIKMMGCPTQ